MSNPPISGHNELKREKRERKKDDQKKKYQHERYAHTCQKLNLMERITYRVCTKMNTVTKIRRLNYTNVLADTVTV